jgi:protein-disulfide isomerase
MLRKILISIPVFLTLSTGSVTAQQSSLTKEDVQDIILETLTSNPEILVDALRTINDQQLQARAELQARETRIREIAANAMGAPIGGNPEGDITLVLFTDYNCDNCREANDVIDSVVEQDGNIRVVYRELPMLGPDSVYAAKAALAADLQGKYMGFHDGLMALETSANTNSVLKVALDAGVDLNKMMVALDDAKINTMIDDTLAIAEEFEIAGTPTYFIGTTVASGNPTAAGLRDVIAKARTPQ